MLEAEDASTEPGRDEAVDRALDRPVRMSLNGETLESLAHRLRGEFSLNVAVDRGSLEDEGVDASKIAVTAELTGVPPAEALELLLSPHDVGWTVRGGTVVLGGAETTEEMTSAASERAVILR